LKETLLHITKTLLTGVAPFIVIGAVIGLVISQPVWTPAMNAGNSVHADSARLRSHVEALAGANVGRRSYPRMDELNHAADYIHAEFAKSAGTVSEQTYSMDNKQFRNVSVTFGPAAGETLVVGAHYDSYGGLPGADDNASGVAGLIELSRLLSNAKPKVTVELVAYTLEEPPFFRLDVMGSMKHAEALQTSGAKVRAMLCLEMIGYFTDKPNSQEFPAPGMGMVYPTKGNFIAIVGSLTEIGLVRRVKKDMLSASDLPVRSINAPADVPGIDFSDHLSYWQHGFRAVMITDTSFYRNKNYHHSGDIPSTLDYTRMAKVVDDVRATIEEIANH
jgi:Zn-dependent M28 family amino/carboxypeptidase